MKTFINFTIISVLLISCQKEIIYENSQNSYLKNLKAALKDSVLETDYLALDFNKGVLSKIDSISFYVCRIPFKGSALESDFVIVKTDSEGKVERGKIINLRRTETEVGNETELKSWDGNIKLSSLDRRIVINSPVENGYIKSFDSQSNLRTAQNPVLVQSIVLNVTMQPTGISFSYWMSMLSAFGGYEMPLPNILFSLNGEFWYGGGSTGEPQVSQENISLDPPIIVDLEGQDEDAEVDLQKYINCFNAIPDAGATCSIEILSDIPVDNDPNMLFNYNSGSPGHTFIQLRKTNGNQSAVQNLGFYPKSGFKTMLTNAPVDGKFVDNGGHEFNASLKMGLSPANFRTTLNKMISLKDLKYDIDTWNCTDWALEVFNATRTTPLEIPLYQIPGSNPPTGSATPQGLYNKLNQIKTRNLPEANNVLIGILLGIGADSEGPCN